MFVNNQDQPLRIQLIDSSCSSRQNPDLDGPSATWIQVSSCSIAHFLIWACIILLNIEIILGLTTCQQTCTCLPYLGLQKLPSAYTSLKRLICGESAVSWPSSVPLWKPLLCRLWLSDGRSAASSWCLQHSGDFIHNVSCCDSVLWSCLQMKCRVEVEDHLFPAGKYAQYVEPIEQLHRPAQLSAWLG